MAVFSSSVFDGLCVVLLWVVFMYQEGVFYAWREDVYYFWRGVLGYKWHCMGVVVNVYNMQRVFSHEYNMLLQQLNTHYPTLIPTTHSYQLVPLSLHPTTPNHTCCGIHAFDAITLYHSQHTCIECLQ